MYTGNYFNMKCIYNISALWSAVGEINEGVDVLLESFPMFLLTFFPLYLLFLQ